MMVVGILNTLAALASATTLFFNTCRSIDCTPNAICGCWSMKIISWRGSEGLAWGQSLWLLSGRFRRSAIERTKVSRKAAIVVAAPDACG